MKHENLYRKPLILGVFFLSLLIASSGYAAVRYEFRQVSRSDFENGADGEVSGTAIIDGEKSRIELRKGGGHPPGTYIISRNDTQMVFIVDPIKKRFAEINAAKIASAFGSSRIQIDNLKSSLTYMNDRPSVAGFPTEHHRLTVTYEITVMFGTLPLKQSVVTTIDKWVTSAFGELADPSLNRVAVRTGNVEIDKLIETEITKVHGFPLRQVTTIQTTSIDAGQNRRSKLKLNPTRRQTSELMITRIAPIIAAASLFEVPAAFAKIDTTQSEEPVGQILTMQP